MPASPGGRPGLVVIWHAVVAFLVATGPTYAWIGQPLSSLPGGQSFQGFVWAGAYTALALLLPVFARRTRIRAVIVAGVAVACWVAGLAVLTVLGWDYSRVVAALSLLVAVPLAVAPLVVGKSVLRLGFACAVALTLGWQTNRWRPVESVATVVTSTLHSVQVTPSRSVLDSEQTRGGAVEPFGDGFIVVTGTGRFFEVRIPEEGGEPSFSRLPLDPPPTYASQRSEAGREIFRILDLALDTIAEPTTLWLSHQFRDPARRCYTIRVSAAQLTDSLVVAPPGWRTAFESAPCLAETGDWDAFETGGRLALTDRRAVLVSIGDHALIGQGEQPMAAQDSTVSYGKVWLIPQSGPPRIFSNGHRNPQGLELDAEGRLWSTEHGPAGGDEINVVEEGGNYGWPLVSYGTQYGLDHWPLASGARNHRGFQEPAHVFVPSIAVSNLIQLRGDHFPGWRGDFLIGSLRIAAKAFRMRTRGRTVTYLEPIEIGHTVRDFAEDRSGRILVWTGERVVALTQAEVSPGELAYGACVTCHGADLEGTASGPSLRGVVGRDIANRHGYAFSTALEAVSGVWDAERLDAFLMDPSAFAPGTSMVFGGIASEETRRALIEFLTWNK